FFFSSRRRHTRSDRDWSSDVCSSDLIDDAYLGLDAQAARLLLEKPAANLPVGAKFYRSELWGLTSRAMGICGSAFIFLDQPEAKIGRASCRERVYVSVWVVA